ncbi:serine/threonine-protein kinase [Sandaracinus amylolyticus]|uniref:non-specific serine/threonine protein kinase n=1 Tax=Sandaracinus amylolyticus TaxID=927083 RepID=A0A0F6YEZ3_9BACT|nr:serine/threonine-protein kinase [Sandaracinus amylolyticus]AKF02970.1 serine/threonine protein kinase [Sandaracinus amylolyticus]
MEHAATVVTARGTHGTSTGSTGGSTGSDVHGAVTTWEHLGNLRRAKAPLLFGLFVWPLFALMDVAFIATGGEGDVGTLVAIRALPLPWFAVATVRVSRRPPITRREFYFLVYGAIYVMMAAITLQSAMTGGFRSLYAEAGLAVLAATTVVPRPWREHAAPMSGAALIYPIGMLVGEMFFSRMQGQITDPQAVNSLGVHVVMLWTTALIVIIASHRLWSLRKEVYEARSIGKYELRRRIGKGGMGEVWAAWHRGLEREVALKILKMLEDDEEGAMLRFEREVRLSSGLTHPHTVRVFDYGTTEDGLLYYAMELLNGVSLAELVKRDGALPAPRAVHLVTQAARALAEAHDRGIVHRDVKPENLFVTAAGGENDFVKVLDFGIARVEADGGHLTRTGAVAGTPSTMSPEVITGDRATSASDVYGLGAVLYYALTGRPPFVGEVAASTLIAHLHEAVVPPSARAPHDVPEDLEAIVLRCLEKKPGDRYPDGRALAEALARSSVAGTWVPAPAPPSIAPPPPSSPSIAQLATTQDAVELPSTANEQPTTIAVPRR